MQRLAGGEPFRVVFTPTREIGPLNELNGQATMDIDVGGQRRNARWRTVPPK